MKVKGRSGSLRNKAKVTLPRSDGNDLVLTVFAMPPDYGDELETELPTPKPEMKGFARNRRGGIEFGRDNQPIKLYADDDPDYLAKVRRVGQLQTVKVVRDCLDPDEVTFDTQRGSMSAESYYLAVREEMKRAGLSAGDIEAIAKSASDASNINMERVLEARGDFFAAGSSQHSTPNTSSASDKDGPTNENGGDSPIENEPAG